MKAELINQENEGENDEVEISIQELDLGLLELDKDKVINIRRTSEMVAALIGNESEIDYTHPVRHKHEVRGGYKRAMKKGAFLSECSVYNLYFRFKGHVDGTGIAAMCRPPMKKEEWILLLPDDTVRRIQAERRAYLDAANYLTLVMQAMESEDQSRLIENLNTLSVHERCAQSLMHEYGHVLHYRMFDLLGITSSKSLQMKWFQDSGYYMNVEMRSPAFADLTPLDKLTELKESFVEDYRISLNLHMDNGKFVLPNKVCYSGDFQNSELMYEGVEVMREMLKPVVGASGKRAGGQSSPELDSLEYLRRNELIVRTTDWRAGIIKTTPYIRKKDIDILQVLDELDQTFSETAAGIEVKH
ncbi:hypothetical protein NYE40_04585 [Paenibacillus sp. FSL W8-1187]|uniref:hypothetical protein n=1 Tax=Paenibacillus TaxID=44249 RepID=UPI0011AF5664|nr:hypothetical protein [Paenibacillus pasadenensis]